MATYFLWGSIALIVIVLIIGFFVGFGRGVKRSSTHVLFVVASVIIAFFITKPITNAIMNVNIQVDGNIVAIKDYIINVISENFVDLSNFDSASAFIQGLPTAIANPIIFLVLMILVFFVMEIIYLIVARISFGRRKKDFENHKPHRVSGGVIGMVEAFLFMIVLFAPITSLTNTYSEILAQSPTTSQSEMISQSEGQYLQTIGDLTGQSIPPVVNEAIEGFNNSAIGKICSLGGFDDAMFDGLSNFEVNGEEICVRDELISLTDSYDSFVVFYNQAVVDRNFQNLDFSTVKKALTHVIENNLFKAVIADTLGDFVLNFDEIKNDMGIELPKIADEIITTLQDRFNTQDFNAYEYLSSDLLSLLDIVDDFVRNGSLIKIDNVDMENLSSILDYVVSDNIVLSSSLKTFVGLNFVSDTLPILLDFANEQIAPNFENDQGLVIAINDNISVEELQSTISTLFEGGNSIVWQVKELDENYNILSLLNSDNVLDAILNMNGISNALVDLGGLMDDVNGLTLFSYTTPNGEVKAIENLLILNGVDLLDDKITDRTQNEAIEISLSTYESVFEYLSEPIDLIISSGLTDLLEENVDFDTILNIMTTNISGTAEVGDENYNFLADILMPFYELDEMSINGQTLKELVFDNVVNLLKDNLGDYVDLETTPETENYETWEARLVSVAELIDSMNGGEIEVEGQIETQTYLEYMLSGNADYFNLITIMNEDGAVENLLNIIFGNSMYSPINELIFDTIDTQVGEFTELKPTTNISNLYTQKAEYINVITTLISSLETLSSFDNDIFTDPNADLLEPFTAIGTVLDTLKTSAKKGVFKEIYINFVWYITGDEIDINEPTYQARGETSFEYADKVREYFGVTNPETGYYEIDFSAEIADLVDFIKLGNQIVENLTNADLTTSEGREEFVTNLKDTLDSIENPKEIVDKATEIVDVVLTKEQKETIQAQGQEIANAIDDYISNNSEGLSQDMQDALAGLKELFGIGQNTNLEV